MLDYINYLWALELGVFGYVVTCVLTRQNYILSWYDDLLAKLERRAKWLAYPLGRCEKCFTGQLALWSWIYRYDYTNDTCLSLLEHGIFISLSILFVSLIKKFAD